MMSKILFIKIVYITITNIIKRNSTKKTIKQYPL